MSAQQIVELVHFIDEEYTSIHQALLHIADTNDEDAARVESESPVVARVLRESSASWRRTAERLIDLCEEVTEEDFDRLDALAARR